MSLSRAARVEARLREEAQRRVDQFRDCKPYSGDLLGEILGEKPSSRTVDTLYVLCVRTVFRAQIPYERYAVPTVIRKGLDELRRLLSFAGPRIMKCSRCGRLYTQKELFDSHTCDHP